MSPIATWARMHTQVSVSEGHQDSGNQQISAVYLSEVPHTHRGWSCRKADLNMIIWWMDNIDNVDDGYIIYMIICCAELEALFPCTSYTTQSDWAEIWRFWLARWKYFTSELWTIVSPMPGHCSCSSGICWHLSPHFKQFHAIPCKFQSSAWDSLAVAGRWLHWKETSWTCDNTSAGLCRSRLGICKRSETTRLIAGSVVAFLFTCGRTQSRSNRKTPWENGWKRCMASGNGWDTLGSKLQLDFIDQIPLGGGLLNYSEWRKQYCRGVGLNMQHESRCCLSASKISLLLGLPMFR